MLTVTKSLIFWSGLGALTVAAAMLLGCGRSHERPPRVEHAILEQKIERIEELLATAHTGPLIALDQGLIAVDESLLEALLTAALPYETLVGGQFRIRVLRATVSCDDGMALVRLDGRASFANQREEEAFAEAIVYGVLRDFELKPKESLLRGHVIVSAFETRRVSVMGGDNESVEGLLSDLAQLQLGALQEADFAFDLPVRLVHDVVLPEVGPEGGIKIPEARFPLNVSVTDVKALRGKLWISLRFRDEPIRSGPPVPNAADAQGSTR